MLIGSGDLDLDLERRQDRVWLGNTDAFQPVIPDFTGDPGVKVDVTDETKLLAMACVNRFFSNSFCT